jgi:hypothetical protein
MLDTSLIRLILLGSLMEHGFRPDIVKEEKIGARKSEVARAMQIP